MHIITEGSIQIRKINERRLQKNFRIIVGLVCSAFAQDTIKWFRRKIVDERPHVVNISRPPPALKLKVSVRELKDFELLSN